MESLAAGNQLVTRISSSTHLYECGRKFGLERYVSTNPSQGDLTPSVAVVARTVEALVGAVWMDSQQSLPAVRRAMQTLDPAYTADVE